MIKFPPLATLIILLSITPSHAEMVTITTSYGAKARVAASAADKFRNYIAALEAKGAVIRFIGGTRKGKCSPPRHKHPCGLALDICQTARGRVDPRCALPKAAEIVSIALSFGLIEGASWKHSDYGHVEIPTTNQRTATNAKSSYQDYPNQSFGIETR